MRRIKTTEASQKPTVLFSDDMSGNRWSQWAGTASYADDVFGTRSLHVTAADVDTACSIRGSIGPIPFGLIESVSLDVRVVEPSTDETNVAVSAYFSGDNFTSWLNTQGTAAVNGDQRITIPVAGVTMNSQSDATKAMVVTHCQLFFSGSPDAPTEVYIKNIVFNEKETPIVIIGVDDGWEECYEMWEECVSRNMPISFYLVSDFIGQSNRLTQVQLDEMHGTFLPDGRPSVAFHCHGKTHLDLQEGVSGGPASYAQARAEYEDYLTWATARGYTRSNEHKHGAYRSGRFNADALQAVEDLGFLTFRLTRDAPQNLTLLNPYITTTQLPDGTGEDASDVIAVCEQWMRSGKTIEFLFHRWVDGEPGTASEFNRTEALAILDWIAAERDAGRLLVMTKNEWHGWTR